MGIYYAYSCHRKLEYLDFTGDTNPLHQFAINLKNPLAHPVVGSIFHRLLTEGWRNERISVEYDNSDYPWWEDEITETKVWTPVWEVYDFQHIVTEWIRNKDLPFYLLRSDLDERSDLDDGK